MLLRDLEIEREDVHVEVRLSEVESATKEIEKETEKETERAAAVKREEETIWPSIDVPTTQDEAKPTISTSTSTSVKSREHATSTQSQSTFTAKSQKISEPASSATLSTHTSSPKPDSAKDTLATPTVPILSSSLLVNESLPQTESHRMTSEAIKSEYKPDKQPDSPSIARRNETRQIPPHATGGESVYGAIAKRITNLERDSSLTLKYIEEQAKFFQRLFGRLEAKLGDVEAAVSFYLCRFEGS